MVAPQRVTPKQYEELVDIWLQENAISIGVCHVPECPQIRAPLEVVSTSCSCGGREMHVCNVCEQDIRYKHAMMFVHHGVLGGCTSSGEILHPTLPYCPSCSASDKYYGCVHIDVPTETPAITQDWNTFSKTYLRGIIVISVLAFVVWMICTYS